MQIRTSKNLFNRRGVAGKFRLLKNFRPKDAQKNPIIAKGNANKVCENLTRLR
jgi:hypothetical protein